MTKYRVWLEDGHRPKAIKADWHRGMGRWVHFFARRPDGGGQTVARFPDGVVAAIEEENGDETTSHQAR